MSVRIATRDDVGAIAQVMVSSWEGTYRGLVPDVLFDQLTVDMRRRQWERFFDEPPERAVCLVSVLNGDVIGMAAVGPARHEADTSVGEVLAIYLVPSHWGQGIGRSLMRASLDWLRNEGFAEAMLWVLDTNERGRRFYESGGWFADGGEQEDASFGEILHEVRYRIDLRLDSES